MPRIQGLGSVGPFALFVVPFCGLGSIPHIKTTKAPNTGVLVLGYWGSYVRDPRVRIQGFGFWGSGL